MEDPATLVLHTVQQEQEFKPTSQNNNKREQDTTHKMQYNINQLVPTKRKLYIKIATTNVSGWSVDKGIRIRQWLENNQVDLMVITKTCRNLDELLPGRGEPYMSKGLQENKPELLL